MNAPQDISMKTEEVLRVELAVFKREHRDLDDAIRALQERGVADQLTLHIEDSVLRFEWGAMVASVPIMVH